MNQMITKHSISFKLKPRFLNNTDGDATVNLEIAVPLKYVSNSWRTLEMLLINCEISVS